MRLLLLIPSILLFFANFSFVKEMPVEKMMAMMEEKDCCRKEKAAGAMRECHKPAKPAQEKKDLQEEAPKQCSKKESTCLCVCCFQFAAPAHILQQFNFTTKTINLIHFSSHDVVYSNPYIAVPWQPPDFM